MPNQFTYQVMKDTNTHSVIKLTGFFDGSSGDESNTRRIVANSLFGALDSSKANLLSSTSNTGANNYYGLSVSKVWYNCAASGTGHVRLYWTADTNQTILGFGNGSGVYNDNGNMITMPNSARGTSNANGNIGIQTFGMGGVANSVYNIVIELRKDNYEYSRGQDRDPAAFNYPPYSITP
jgi:hypothetical protein